MPSGNITITPGRVLVDGPVTLAMLNDLGNPTARVDEGAIGPRELAPEAFTSANFADGSFAVVKLEPSATPNQVIRTVDGVVVWSDETEADTQRYAVIAASVGNQSVDTDGTPTQLLLQSEILDTGGTPGVFNPATGKYTAAVAGVHCFAFQTQCDNDTGTASGMQVSVRLTRNGTFNDGGTTAAVASPPGARWFTSAALLVSLAANDTIELTAEVLDGVGSGQVSFSNLRFHAHLVMPL